MLSDGFDAQAAEKWLGGSVAESQERYRRVEPEAEALAEAWLRFENLGHADHVMTTVELVFAAPWATTESELFTLFGEDRQWLAYEHDSVPKTLVFEAAGGSDAKGTACVRLQRPVDEAGEGWQVPSILLRRIWGPRRA